MSFHVPNQYRFRDKTNVYGSDDSIGNYGVFFIPFESYEIKVIASEGMEWEHVSASHANRCPNWKEMCFLKDLFWDGEDVVMQLHPKKSQYVNQHEFTLHLWRPTKEKIPTPPQEFVGI